MKGILRHIVFVLALIFIGISAKAGVQYCDVEQLLYYIEFADGHITEYLYDASGRKLQTKYLVDNRSLFAASVSGEIEEDELMATADSSMIETELIRDYVGNYVYEDSVLERTITPTGYITSGGAYKYYILDHQGNITTTVPINTRSPWLDYYPFGSPMARMTSNERYKFSGKEFDTKNGIYFYDFHARQYSPILDRFTSLDPHAEKYYGYSPYAFCRNNPVRFTDPTGCVVETLWDVANISLGVNSFVDNVSAGNVTAAIVDGVGIAVDVTAAILPVVPGGAGTAIKAVRAADNAVDAVNIADDIVDVSTSIGQNHKYKNIPNPQNIGIGKKTTPSQRRKLLNENYRLNNGVLKSDGDGRLLNWPSKNIKGQKADLNQAEVDHIIPRSKGGTNSNDNLQILSKEENLKKGNKYYEP